MARALLSARIGLAAVLLLFACRTATLCTRCDTLVIAATGEPSALLPPLVGETVGRDVSDLIFERLAELPGGGSPLDSSAYRPRLAVRWERVDSLTLRFHLRPGARWQDDAPLTAGDVVFSFGAYADSALEAQAGPAVERVRASAPDDSTVLLRFPAPDPEQWYDATWHVRILPRHLWDSIPRARWAADTATARLIGSGAFRLSEWRRGQSLTLVRRPGVEDAAIQRVVWRFAGEQDAALDLLLSHEADLLEAVGDSAQVARVEADPALQALPYPSAVYGFLGFNLGGRPAPWHGKELRKALALATDRETAAHGALGAKAAAPPGPMSRVLWIADDSVAVTPYDSATAAKGFDAAGWPRGSDGMRRRGQQTLSVDILVPATSAARRNLAQILQEQWRRAGVRTTISSVDFPVFQQRLRTGQFESFVGAWLDEPSPRGLAQQWTSAGIGGLNYCAYRSAAFDSLFARAAQLRGTLGAARQAWREALDTLNADVPAIWLYTPTNVAGATRRLSGITVDPWSWLATLESWHLGSGAQ
ncbi:MAG TPA: peptide ABC transporter substrate-binding protein [Gemmatimonadales bacterium]|nr:peptide ABC transporter substrate-binding protein [Gemmatimonadales bacterium]